MNEFYKQELSERKMRRVMMVAFWLVFGINFILFCSFHKAVEETKKQQSHKSKIHKLKH